MFEVLLSHIKIKLTSQTNRRNGFSLSFYP